MTSGLEWNEWEYPYNDPRNIWNQMTQSDDWLQFVLGRSCIYEPGERWFYNSGGSMLLSGILRNSTGQQAKDFGLQNLFTPLGISEYIWNSNPAGLTMTYSNLFIRPRDMAKIGYIYINKGEWNGIKILSEEWIEEATRDRIMTTSGDARYGYQWWKRNYNVNNTAVESFSAEGSGENYIFCFDSLDMIVIITAANWDVWFNVLDIVPRFILPSLN
jgi:CubicO group peptidase (beta-lactamase class C family)